MATSVLALAPFVAMLALNARAQTIQPNWEAEFNVGTSFIDVRDTCSDGAGSVWITGNTAGTGADGQRGFVLRVAPDGALAWGRRTPIDVKVVGAVAPLPSGAVLAAGWADGHGVSFLTIDTEGVLQSDRRSTTPLTGPGNVYDAAADGAGNAWTCGWEISQRAWIARMDAASGDVAYTFLDGAAGVTGVNSLALASDGSVFAAGSNALAGSSLEGAIARLASDGSLSWTRNLPGPMARTVLSAAGVDSSARVVVVGSSAAIGGASSIGVAAAFDAAGNLAWRRDLDLGPHPLESFAGVVCDPASGRIFVAGTASMLVLPMGSTPVSALTACVDASGNLMWSQSWDAPPSGTRSTTNALALAGAEIVLATRFTATPALSPAGIGVRGYDLAGQSRWEAVLPTHHPWGAVGVFANAAASGAIHVTHWDVRSTGGGPDRLFHAQLDLHGRRTYCTAKISSSGCVPAIGAVGFASASSGAPFHVRATSIERDKNGLAILSASGAAELPFQGGLRCVATPFVRGPMLSSGGLASQGSCSGELDLDFDSWLAVHPTNGWNAGTLVDAQFWFRDPADPYGIGLSDGLEFLIEP